MKTLEEYLINNYKKGNVAHNLRATVETDGQIAFSINPAFVGGDIVDFYCESNTVMPRVMERIQCKCCQKSKK
jgi:hypothetical protein